MNKLNYNRLRSNQRENYQLIMFMLYHIEERKKNSSEFHICMYMQIIYIFPCFIKPTYLIYKKENQAVNFYNFFSNANVQNYQLRFFTENDDEIHIQDSRKDAMVCCYLYLLLFFCKHDPHHDLPFYNFRLQTDC